MIFDEATSSLGAKSEKAIQDTIYGLIGKQTLIIIAQRSASSIYWEIKMFKQQKLNKRIITN